MGEPLSVLGAAMASQPDLSLADAVQQCMAQQTPLTLRLLLELQERAIRALASDAACDPLPILLVLAPHATVPYSLLPTLLLPACSLSSGSSPLSRLIRITSYHLRTSV